MPFLETCQLEQRISMLRDYDLNVWCKIARNNDPVRGSFRVQ